MPPKFYGLWHHLGRRGSRQQWRQLSLNPLPRMLPLLSSTASSVIGSFSRSHSLWNKAETMVFLQWGYEAVGKERAASSTIRGGVLFHPVSGSNYDGCHLTGVMGMWESKHIINEMQQKELYLHMTDFSSKVAAMRCTLSNIIDSTLHECKNHTITYNFFSDPGLTSSRSISWSIISKIVSSIFVFVLFEFVSAWLSRCPMRCQSADCTVTPHSSWSTTSWHPIFCNTIDSRGHIPKDTALLFVDRKKSLVLCCTPLLSCKPSAFLGPADLWRWRCVEVNTCVEHPVSPPSCPNVPIQD